MTDEFQKIPDEELARAAQAGDWTSFDELVRRFEARIYGFVLTCCGGHEANARDLTQETFVSAYLNLKRFDPSRSLLTWLFMIARRKCIDRSRRVRPESYEEVPELPDDETPSALAERRDTREHIWRVARKVLPDLQFQTLWLHYAEDLSVREIASVVRRTQPHVKVLLFRARRTLARELKYRTASEQTQSSVGRMAQGVVAHSARLVGPRLTRSL